ncbi:hypothetical protein OG302_35260 [Streptomyces sp. NBC_01283]|uniref:DUF6777 domain-containing protein n=1 Tax=Streptomyces sp. NBC_01283 TaxID=2903812 RepID=UPI00352EAD67|nr:hypothetical protein OG302_35260 [Streptomyces sp. NBC_01283]
MSAEPPSSGRPTGPPSGPLSGPQGGPPSGPPSPPPDSPGPPGGASPGGGSGEGPEKPDRPWWKSAPRVAAISLVLVAAVVLTVVLTRPDGTSKSGGEVALQPAGKQGPDPFTESTARDDSTPPSPSALPSSSASANVTRGVDGAAPGLYGGTRKVGSCDVEKQVGALKKDPAKNKAFASVLDIDASAVPAYLRALTPVQLRMDTRVTNHGYRDGAPTAYQAVLQAGTAVLVDDRGVPRVRCACGNPLLPPVAQSSPKRTGDAWPGYRSSNVVVVAPAAQTVNVFVMYDPESGDWFERDKGDTGAGDTKTRPPAHQPSPSASPSPSQSSSASPSSSSASPSSGEPSSPPASSSASQPPSTEQEQPPASQSAQPQSSP